MQIHKAGHLPEEDFDPHFPIPSVRKRRLAAGILAGLVSLSAAGAVVVSTCTLCYSVTPAGEAPVAYIRRADTYQQAVCQVEEQVSQILQTQYDYPQDTQVSLTIAPKEQLQTSDQLTVSLMETVSQVQEAWVLTVDGVSAGACLTQEMLERAVILALAGHTTEDTVSVAVLSQVEKNLDYLPADTKLLTAEELAQILLGQPDPESDRPPAALLKVETVERVTYTQAIPAPVQEQEDPSRIIGERGLLQEGAEGTETRTDLVTRQNGMEIKRENVSAATLVEPTPAIVGIGTAQGVDAAKGRFLTPTEGRLTSPFGQRYIFGSYSFHTGIDLANAAGTPILASASGTVSFSGAKGSYGNLLKIDHGNGFVTYYAHCSQLLAKEGDWVEQGQTIALMGSTGRSTGPHLHFEVRWLDEPLDPELCLP